MEELLDVILHEKERIFIVPNIIVGQVSCSDSAIQLEPVQLSPESSPVQLKYMGLRIATKTRPVHNMQQQFTTTPSRLPRRMLQRNERTEDENGPAVHCGLIVSADRLTKDAQIDYWEDNYNVWFELLL